MSTFGAGLSMNFNRDLKCSSVSSVCFYVSSLLLGSDLPKRRSITDLYKKVEIFASQKERNYRNVLTYDVKYFYNDI